MVRKAHLAPANFGAPEPARLRRRSFAIRQRNSRQQYGRSGRQQYISHDFPPNAGLVSAQPAWATGNRFNRGASIIMPRPAPYLCHECHIQHSKTAEIGNFEPSRRKHGWGREPAKKARAYRGQSGFRPEFQTVRRSNQASRIRRNIFYPSPANRCCEGAGGGAWHASPA